MSPMPSEKKFAKPREFNTNPWNIGDVYAYCFHTKQAEACGLLGKYILFQKVGDVEYYKDKWYSVVQIFDKVYEKLPELGDVENVRILPQVSPPGVNGCPNRIDDYAPSFQWFLKATMLYEKAPHYPKRHFTFIGNKAVEEVPSAGNDFTDFFLSKDGMEAWLTEYYLAWRNVTY